MAGLLDAVKGVISGGEKAISGISAGVSTILSSKDKSIKNENSNVVYASFGMAASAGKQRIAGSGSLPAANAKSSYKAKSDNTEKLLTDVVKYLVSINGTLKKQIDFDRKVYQENALAAREAKIEQNSIFNDLGKRYGAANDNEKQSKGGILSTILSVLGGFVTNFAKLGLSTLFKGFKAAIKAFSTAWKWLRGLSFLKNIKSLVGLVNAIAAGPALAALGSSLLILWGMDKFMKDARKKPMEALKGLEKYGMKAVLNEQGFTEGYVLPDGKTYNGDNLPSKYQDILDAYGPSADPKWAFTKNARERIAANPGAYDPDAMAKELKGGEKVGGTAPSATQPGTIVSDSAYDVVLGFGKFGKPEDYFDGRKLSQLTVAEALWFGRNVLLKNSGDLDSSAMGAYQIVSKTLQGLVDQGVVKLTDTFDAATQDRAAKAIYDQANKSRNLDKQWAYYNPMYGGTGQKTDSRSFEEAKTNIMKKEGTLGGSNSAPATTSSGGSMLDTAASTAKDMASSAAGTADKVLTNIADFIGHIGGKIVGPGVSRNLTTTGPDFAKLISEESNKIQNQIAMGEKKTASTATNIPSAAQTLKSASPTGSISVINPNYPGSGGIEKYLAHYKLAA